MESNQTNIETTIFSFSELVDLTSRLGAIINEETNLLRQMKVSSIKDLQIEKHKIAALLEKQQRALKGNPAIRSALTEAEKETLRYIAGDFDAILQTYQRELFKAQQVNQIIIDRINDTVKQHVEKERTYNARGVKHNSGMELARNTPAIKFNQNI
jgi:hypothetical protein